MDVCHDGALRSWILSFGPGVRVQAPESLARQVAADLEAARARYRGLRRPSLHMARRTLLATATLAGLSRSRYRRRRSSGSCCGSPRPHHRRRGGRCRSSVPSDRDLLDVAVSADGAPDRLHRRSGSGRARALRPPARPVRRPGRARAPRGRVEPFFSPDGGTVGFFAEGLLKTVSLADDAPPPAIVCRLGGEPAGGAWAPGGTIVFGGPGRSGLRAGAGRRRRAGRADRRRRGGGRDGARVAARDRPAPRALHGGPPGPRSAAGAPRPRDGRVPRTLPLADGGGHFVAPSAVVFARRGEVFAAPPSTSRAAAGKGPPSPRPVLRGVAGRAVGDRGLGRSRLAAARDGTIVFAPPASGGRRFAPGSGRCGTAGSRRSMTSRRGTRPRASPRTAGAWRSAQRPRSCAATSGCSTSSGERGGGSPATRATITRRSGRATARR